jgi:aconitate hydratase
MPESFLVDDNMIVRPPADGADVEIVRGPNIKPLPTRGPLEEDIAGEVLLVTGDNITTDHIMPAGAQILPLRSNIPAMSEFAFLRVDPAFPERARAAGGGLVIGGENYGQGSSREHAALVPMYLGVQAVIAKSFARIHKANLVNVGILPLEFADPADHDRLALGDRLRIAGAQEALRAGGSLTVENVTQGYRFQATYDLSERQVDALLAGGLLNLIRSQA